MKFSNGCWLNKEGIECYSPQDICGVYRKGEKIEILAPSKKIKHRGDTLGGPVITYSISAPMKDVFKVHMEHYKGTYKIGPYFEINESMAVPLELIQKEDTLEIRNGELSLIIDYKENWKMSFYRKGKKLTSSDFKSAAYIKEHDTEFMKEELNQVYMREQLSLSVGELIYGLGERFTPFIKNGQSIETWNEDGGTSTEQSYKAIPFYISSKDYGILVNHPERVSFEVGSEKVTKVQFSVPGENLEYYIIAGDNMKEVISNYTTLTGKPALPPAWSFGLWLTTSFTTNYDEATVMSFIDGMAQREVPLHVFHFDCFWMKGFNWCDFTWDSDVFPDPVGMIKRIKEKGLKVCVWINPYIAQASCLFDEAMEKGYLLKREDGSVWQWDMWQPGMGIVDFTHPEASAWFKEKLMALLDMGVDCFKTDFGERIPTKDVVYFDKSDPEKMHNYYTQLYNKTVFEVLKEKRGEGEAVLFARSATVGGQQFPVHWGGDCSADYESMAESLRGGLSLCLSGFGFWSHDIGGFESTSTPDVYKRWAAFGLLSSHSRLHGSTSYRVPWLYDEEAVEVVRYFSKLKCKLMPYLFKEAFETSKTGISTMRAMVVEFEKDPMCMYLDKQYMLGESILIAPIFNEEGLVQYYVPEGKWTNFLTDECIEGGRWITQQHGYKSIPMLVRPNGLIALGNNDSRPDYDYREQVQIAAYALLEGQPATTQVVNTNKEVELDICMLRSDQTITISFKGNHKPFYIVLKNITDVKQVEGGSFTIEKDGVHILPEIEGGKIVCYL